MGAKKVCAKCSKPKSIGVFSKRTRSKDGLSPWCKTCVSLYDKRNYKNHRDEMLGERLQWARSEHGKEIRNAWARENKRRLRLEAVDKLGGRCSNSKCRWLNDDGTFGCTDSEILQIDHKGGGGHKELKEINCPSTYYKQILADTTGKYQLLCANCNWKKRFEKGELFR